MIKDQVNNLKASRKILDVIVEDVESATANAS